MSVLRIVAVDDEALALRRLAIVLGQMEDVELAGTSRGGRDGVELIRRIRPDVLLLDINMAGFDGFDVVEALGVEDAPLIIFVTAFDEYAVKAFQVSAIDYLLKPIEFDRLREALAKARTRLELADAEQRAAELTAVVENLRRHRPRAEESRFESEIWVPRTEGFVRVLVADVDWVEAERDYVHLHTPSGSYMLRETMAGMEARLDPAAFIRVRRSALVRRERIASVRRTGYGQFAVALQSGRSVPVGRTYVARVRELLQQRRPE